MKRVLLLNPPGKRPYIRDNYCSYSVKANYFWEPIDLLVQSGWLSQNNEIAVHDAIAMQSSVDQVVGMVRQEQYDVILSLVGAVSFEEDRLLFTKLKEATGVTIGVTGDMCLTHSDKVFDQAPAVDAVITDYTTRDFSDYLDKGPDQTRRTYGSMAYRYDGRIVPVNPEAAPGLELDYPVPRHELFPIDRYRISTSVERRFATCIASSGCNFNCPFCICSLMKLRLRNIDSLLAELRKIRDMGIREVYFYDPHFTVNKKRCTQMLEAMLDEKLDLIFSCNSHITVSEQVLDLLARAGCHTIMFGIETADEALLEQYSKGITQAKVRLTLEQCRARGIRTFGYFMIGLPGESEESILETIRYATRLPLQYASFNFPSPVVGTELYREACEKGLLADTTKNLDRSSEVSVSLNGMSSARLLELKRLAYRRFYLRPLFLIRTILTIFPRKKWGFFLKDALTFFRRNFL